ncbi:MAG TPA: AlkA N-terminal domain-containing protein [Trebonia sp.]|nr:AlkA N-terminal domain-containing protein [Trebonia sp.]
MDDDQRYQAAASKDARFDGVFFVAVTSTGIYCRPSCPAITPKRANARFYPTAAAAQRGGFRACKRCRPDASPGSPEWNARADVTARAMRLIADGIIDRTGVEGLAASLGYEQRQVRRLLTAELGAGPLAIARAQRAQAARVLIETTGLDMGDIAFAAGFTSIRQFNATIHEVFDATPTGLRERARPQAPQAPPGVIRLRLPLRPPIDLDRLLGFLAARAIPGVEELRGTTFTCTTIIFNGPALLSVRPCPAGTAHPYVECDLTLSDLRHVTAAVQRCRRLLDLDADPHAITGHLTGDPVIGPLARACPGRRSPGCVDGDDLAIRAVLGQQVSVTAARTLGGRLAAAYGKPLAAPSGTVTHCFPDAATLAGADPDVLARDVLRVPRSRGAAIVALATALASGELALHPGADRDEATARLLARPGIGPWTASYIRMRALSDPDAYLPADAGLRRALRQLGQDTPAGAPLLRSGSPAWRPWRSYAVHHLWATLEPTPEVAEKAR